MVYLVYELWFSTVRGILYMEWMLLHDLYLKMAYGSVNFQVKYLNKDNRGNWFHGVMVSTLDSESSDPSSNLGGTWTFYFNKIFFLKVEKILEKTVETN